MKEKSRFSGLADLTLTPMVWLTTLALPGVLALLLRSRFELSAFTTFGIALFLVVVATILALNAVRRIGRIREGVYFFDRDRAATYAWSLYGFLWVCNFWSLGVLRMFIPAPFRKHFYSLLGAKFGPGIIPIGGMIDDPYLVTVEQGAMLGADCAIIPHGLIRTSEGDAVVLARVHVGRNVIIGAHSVIMPGVTIGEGSMINAMSVVSMNTKIPPYEVWGGVPAQKLQELPRGRG